MRGDFIKQYLSTQRWALSGSYAKGILRFLNSNDVTAKAEEYKGGIVPAQTYEKVKNVAIISVKGAMDTTLSPMAAKCVGNIANYAAIGELVDMANADTQIDTILFRVSSPGGNVNGAEVLSNKINNCKKRTVTLYEDIGASAAILIFGGAKERYATSTTTYLGSIGVRTAIPKQDSDEMEIIVSSNAPNKVCTGGSCRDKVQAEIDEIEEFFIERVCSYTGWTAEQVINNFNKGGEISAKKALENGFIVGINDYDTILAKLIQGTQMADTSGVETPKQFAAERIEAILTENAMLKAMQSERVSALIAVAIMSVEKGLSAEAMKAAMMATSEKGIQSGMDKIVEAATSTGSTVSGVFMQEQKTKPIDYENIATKLASLTGNNHFI